jgi:hypothetical protein
MCAILFTSAVCITDKFTYEMSNPRYLELFDVFKSSSICKYLFKTGNTVFGNGIVKKNTRE